MDMPPARAASALAEIVLQKWELAVGIIGLILFGITMFWVPDGIDPTLARSSTLMLFGYGIFLHECRIVPKDAWGVPVPSQTRWHFTAPGFVMFLLGLAATTAFVLRVAKLMAL